MAAKHPVIYPVIMCGGSGTRLWPLSRKATPKQYWALAGEDTMLQATLKRVAKSADLSVAPTTIICAKGHEGVIRDHAAKANVPIGDIVLEPMGRNTAPVAAVAAALVREKDPDGLILLVPADHHVADPAEFWTCVGKGVAAAQDGALVTLGIHAAKPETGYGYIERGDQISDDCYGVKRFVEKPNAETAAAYLADGGYYWNAGIFLFQAEAMDREMRAHARDISEQSLKALDHATRDNGVITLDKEKFAACPSDSIDYAVMEKTENAAIVAPVNIGWNDIGAWEAVADLQQADGTETVGDVLTEDCKNSFIRSDGPLVAAIGIEDLVVVATDDAILITRKGQSQDVKKIVEQLKKTKREELL